jgi:hypothetical protein
LLCAVGCADKGGKPLRKLSIEKMQEVMWDIIEADVFTDRFIKKDSLKNASVENMKLQNKIFALHKVTRADYYESYEYYTVHADLMKVILDSMSAKAERDRTKMAREHFMKPAKQPVK